MPYRLKASESVPEGIRRIVLEELDSAQDQLGRNGRNRDEAIHEARKSVKKIRGAVRLVESDLGAIYRDENRRLGDLGRKLTELRDAAAIIETFDAVVGKYKDSLQNEALASVRRGLDKSKRETERNSDVDKVVKGALATLKATAKRVSSWPLKSDGFSAIEPGLRARFRRGRETMAVAQKDPTPENYHEWRKRVKDHWYHIRLLESLWTDVMQAREASLHDLETWLGDDHNLVVLRDKLADKNGHYGDQKDVQFFVMLADQYQRELREKSISLGERIYEEKPREFTKNVSKLWDAWQRQPESMKEEQKEDRGAAKKGAQSAGSPTAAKSKTTAA
ncbi:MAG: CHAD domain-containing protein [Acidobacteriaceae bacterium]|nr:CHAD domain-containing protein [Acidobacteriaceae bacterium]MBV9782156.1 CHAD domain-containing protein [Acidobacteriaceae bacterium]